MEMSGNTGMNDAADRGATYLYLASSNANTLLYLTKMFQMGGVELILFGKICPLKSSKVAVQTRDMNQFATAQCPVAN